MTTREPISIENGRVEIHAPENRVWLTRHQIADLFGVFVPAVGSNIRSILKSGILCEERVYRRERNRDGGIVEPVFARNDRRAGFPLKIRECRSLPTVACPKGHDDRCRLAAPRHEHDIELKRRTANVLAVLLYTHSCPPIHFFRESSRNFCISDSMYSTLP